MSKHSMDINISLIKKIETSDITMDIVVMTLIPIICTRIDPQNMSEVSVGIIGI